MTTYINGWTIVLSVFFLFLSCWFGLIQYYGMPYGDTSSAGVFGDQFGAVNALFSALALAGVIYTLIQQQQEMKAQRREFMNNRSYTLAYKQVELVNKELEKGMYSRSTELSAQFEFDIFDTALSNIRDANMSKDIIAFQQFYARHGKDVKSILRVLANSSDLFVRLYNSMKKDQLESIDEDTNILFVILRYNLPKNLWDFIALTNGYEKVFKKDIDQSIRAYYFESLERINRFNEIYYQIKKDTDEIDGK